MSGLDSKFRLMTMIAFDKRIKRKHVAVYGFILDWYHTRYGNALASVRHIVSELKARDPAGVGFFNGDVHSALKDLVEWGYLDQQKGSGRSASRYVPVWSKHSVQDSQNTNVGSVAFGETPNADVRETPNANPVCVQDSPNKDPFTGPGLPTRGHVKGNSASAAPSAPPASGAVAPRFAASALEGFDTFWLAWPRKHGKQAAEREWKKAKPEDHQQILTAARTWSEHYITNGTDKRWIPEPANWLAKERWHEDLPLSFNSAKEAATSRKVANSNSKHSRRGPLLPDDRTHLLTIKRVEIEGNPYSDFWQTFVFDLGEREIEQRYHIVADGDAGPDSEGCNALMKAVGYNEMTNPESEIIGASVLAANAGKGRLSFYRPPVAA